MDSPYSIWESQLSDPTQIKHYEILSRLGEGGMGVVYRARDTRLGRTVALKMLSGEFGLDPERRHRFEREARIVSSMSHPGIATLFDFDTDEGSAFLTMELIDGPTLRDVLKSGPMPLDALLECGAQVAEAMGAAHELGVIHRDLKPENIMVAGSGYYKVLDFGVARIDGPGDQPGQDHPAQEGLSNTQTPTRWLTQRGALMGTVAYMSPEQVQGENAEAASDIFSFGSVLHELATGRPAFARPTEVATLHAIAYEEATDPRELRPEIQRGLALVIGKCLAKDRSQRYASAADLASDLRMLKQQTDAGTGKIQNLLAYRRPRKRRTLGWALGGVAVAVLLAAVGFVGWRMASGAPQGILPAASIPAQPVPIGRTAAPAATHPFAVPRVIVAFFENHTGDAGTDWISTGLPEMLTTDLSRSPQLEVIATQRLHDLLANAGKDAGAPLDRSTTAELARWARADIVISGSVFKLGDQYRIDAQAYDVKSGTMSTAHKVSGTELFGMVEELTAGLLDGLTSGEMSTPSLQAVTQSEEAFRAFTEGKSLYANLRFAEAAERFRQSMDHDAEFVLPQIHLATSLFSMNEYDKGLAALDTALANPEALPEADRLLAQGLDAYFRDGDHEDGAKLFAQLIDRFPRNPEPHVWLGRARSELEGDPMGGIRQLRAALKIDRNYLPAVARLADEMSGLGAEAESENLLRQVADRSPMAKEAIEARLSRHSPRLQPAAPTRR